MKNTILLITRTITTFLSKGMFLALIFLLVFSNAAGAVSFQAAASAGPNKHNQTSLAFLSDDFNTCSLDTNTWEFVNPRGDATLVMNGTQALISVPGGISHNAWEGINNSARLMQSIGDTNFEIEVKFQSPTNQQSQMQGILIEQDSQNFLRFEYRSDGSRTILYAASIVDGIQTQQYSRAMAGGDTLFMRVRKQSNRWRQQFSVNGQNWTTAAHFNHTMTVRQGGIFAGNAGSNPPAHTAVIDYAFNVASPISPEDAVSHDYVLNSSVNGNGSIQVNPGQASYTCSEEVQLTAVAEEGWSFSGWSGDLSGNDNPAALLVNQNKTVTASFTASQDNQPPAITDVQVSAGTNNATIRWSTDEPATSHVDYGVTDTYELGQVEGSELIQEHSLQLNGLQTGKLYHYRVSSTDNAGNTAYYEDATFTTASSALQLSVNVNGSGAVTLDPNSNEYSPGQVVSLTAAANEGSYFSGWSGDLSGSDNPVTFTMQSSMTVTATFAEINSEPTSIVSDDFNMCNINSALWSFVDPRGDTALVLNGTQALISIPGGVSHDAWSGGNNAPRLMQPVTDTDFSIEAKFESAIGPQAQFQGILIQQDNENYLRFDFYSDGSNTHAFAASFINGSPTIRYDSIVAGAGEQLFLQVHRQGNQWKQFYSLDGQNWEAGANFSHELVVTQAGVFAGNAGNNPPAHTAVIDYFFNMTSPIVPEDALSFERTLTTGVTGSGSISANPSKTTYACNEPVQLTAVPQPGWAFNGWSGDLSGSENPFVITMTGNKSVSAAFIESQDNQPPVISGIQVNPGMNTATITWNTDEPATSRVQYGLTDAYEMGDAISSSFFTQHTVSIGGLQPGTLYHYRVSSTDGSGNTAAAQDAVFTTPTSETIIDVWYGDVQSFGRIGNPQEWINIFGNVSDPDGIASLNYSLNGGSTVNLTVGPDGARLQRPGDFNIDIHRTALLSGSNQVLIRATDNLNNQTVKQVEVLYQPGNVWPIPYNLDWSSAASIQDVAQVVDGKWSLQANGVRTAQTGYDRLIAIGDLAWQDYEVEVPITVHSIDFASAGGMSGDPALGLLMHWTGHTDDPIAGRQPKTGFIPFGDIAWWRWSSSSQANLEFYGSGIAKSFLPLLNTPYIFKMNVETVPGIERIYRVKAWQSGQAEPGSWDLIHHVPLSNLDHGSFMLVAHHVDATFGNVSARPLGPSTYQLTVSTVGGGSVTTDPAQSQYDPGQVVSLTATPHAGWYFAGWSGDLSGSANPASITMNGDRSVTAVFSQVDVEPSDIVSDDFNMCSINNELWSFVNPLNDATLVLNGSQVLLSVPGGVSHDIWDSGNFAPRLMQPVTNTNFGLEVKYESLLNQQYQMQGILIEQDSNNFLRIEFHSDGASTRLFAASFTNGSPVIQYNQAIVESDAAYFLRVHRQDNQFIVLYSYDGQNWVTGAGFNHNLVVTQIGVFAGNAGSNPAHTSVIDYFFNIANPIQPEDALTFAHSLNTSISGSGSIQRSPDNSTYACNAAVQLTAIPEEGWAFNGWSGDLSGSDNPATITMNADKNVTATFIESQDDQPPVISGVQVSAEADKATITWTTDEPASSRVQYGLTNGYELGEVGSTELTLAHSVVLNGLQAGTLYHYRVISTDEAGNTAHGADATFTTDSIDLSGIVSDHFSSTSLNTAVWTFVNPLEDSELTLNGSHALLSVPAGTSHDLWTGGNFTPRLMQAANDTDFEIEVKLDSLVLERYEMQGILIEQDGQNYLRFEFYGDGQNVHLFAASVISGSPSVRSDIVIGDASTSFYLRVKRQGEQWSHSVSLDGQNWSAVGSYQQSFVVAKVGVYAGNAGENPPAHTAEIDYFINTASP